MGESKKRWRYQGPATGIELAGEEYMIHPGQIIELAGDHPLAMSWLAHHYLVEEAE